MSFWSRLTGRKSATSSWGLLRELLSGAGTSKAGTAVNWRTALECGVAVACARVIADGLAQVPFKVYRSLDGGGRREASDQRIYDLLSRAPNGWQTSYEFREQLALHLVFCSDAFAWINRVRGEIQELLPFEPQNVTVTRDGWDLRYAVRLADGSSQQIPAAEMWHLRGPSWNGWQGLQGVRMAREAIGLALATEEHGARLFSNGAMPGGVLSTDATLSDEQRKALRESWQATHGGGANAFKTAILWGGLKWNASAMESDKAQFIETRRFQVEEVCRAFRVMPIMVGYSDKAATYASAEQMFLAHVTHTLGPWYARIEQSADRALLTEAQRKQGLYTRFVVQGLMRGASAERAEYYTKLYQIGALNPNEIRELEERNPYAGGDEYRVPLNMQQPGTSPAA